MKELRTLYEFSVPKVVEKPVSTKETVNGETVTVTKTEKTIEQNVHRLVKPTRRMYEAADIFYSVAVSEFIKAGLLPISLIAKRYANDGGTLNEIDKNRLEVYSTELKTLEKQFIALATETVKNVEEEKKDILLKMNEAGIAIEQLKNDYSSIYENTAEAKARHKTAIWWVLHLSQKKKADGTYEFLFGEGSYEDRLNVYDDFADNVEPYIYEVIQRLAYLVAFWIAAKAEVGETEFKSIDEVYLKGISEYKPDVEPSVKVEENASTPEVPPQEAPPDPSI